MLRDKKFYLRVLTTVLLAGSIFGMAVGSSVRATPVKNPAQQGVETNTPTDSSTIALTPTDTSTNTLTQTDTPTDTQTPTDTPTVTLTPSITLTSTNTATPSRTSTFTPTFTSTGTPPTQTPTAPGHIVISEFRTLGPLGADDEFVELYNPTGAAVNIGGWLIKKSSGCGTSIQTLMTITSGTILQPGQHYLLASVNNSLPTTNQPDQTFTLNIADTGGLALVNSSLSVDQVGMCAGTYYHEGNFLQPLPIAPLPETPTPSPGTSSQSYERKPGGNTACYDTNDNASDFALISPAHPQNQDSEVVKCAGVVLTSPTPTLAHTPTRTRTPARTPTAFPAVAVLNEFLPHPQIDWNGDGTANVGDEYIEIINLGSSALNVMGWKLDIGLNNIKTFTLPDLTLQPRQIAAFFGSQTGISLSDGGSTVRLLRPDGRIVDAYTYPVVEIPERTWCRLPDGGGWGFACRPSPGQPNVSINDSIPGSGSLAGGKSSCPQVNTAPQSLVLAECDSFGSEISNDPGERVFWLESRWKWDVFLE